MRLFIWTRKQEIGFWSVQRLSLSVDEVKGTLYLEANIEKVFTQIDEVNRILSRRGSCFIVNYNYSRYFNSTDDDKTDI